MNTRLGRANISPPICSLKVVFFLNTSSLIHFERKNDQSYRSNLSHSATPRVSRPTRSRQPTTTTTTTTTRQSLRHTTSKQMRQPRSSVLIRSNHHHHQMPCPHLTNHHHLVAARSAASSTKRHSGRTTNNVIRASEYRNLRQVVPSLRRQRDLGKVEVVTEAAKYIDHLHKTLIKRFVSCGIPESLKGKSLCLFVICLASDKRTIKFVVGLASLQRERETRNEKREIPERT